MNQESARFRSSRYIIVDIKLSLDKAGITPDRGWMLGLPCEVLKYNYPGQGQCQRNHEFWQYIGRVCVIASWRFYG